MSRKTDDDAIAAFLANGGAVQKIEAEASTIEQLVEEIANAAVHPLTGRGKRRLAYKLRSGSMSASEAREAYPAYDAERAAERRQEAYGRARLGGATVSQALDEANYLGDNLETNY